MQKRLLLILAFLFSLGCSKDKTAVPVYNVPTEFQPLVSSFVHEAALRHDTLVINNLIIRYDSSISISYCALCNSLEPNVQKLITVNPKVHCYNNALEREALFFHELGHCILGRSHTDARLPNGDPKSIMVKDNIGLYSSCLYPIGGACQDNSFKRLYYLDELFNPQTPVPLWGQ